MAAYLSLVAKTVRTEGLPGFLGLPVVLRLKGYTSGMAKSTTTYVVNLPNTKSGRLEGSRIYQYGLFSTVLRTPYRIV
jgi:hypothetical protein